MKKIVVDENTCIGCGFCFSSNELFKMNDDGYAFAKENNLDEMNDEEKEKVIDVKEGCPVGAIKIEEE